LDDRIAKGWLHQRPRFFVADRFDDVPSVVEQLNFRATIAVTATFDLLWFL